MLSNRLRNLVNITRIHLFEAIILGFNITFHGVFFCNQVSLKNLLRPELPNAQGDKSEYRTTAHLSNASPKH